MEYRRARTEGGTYFFTVVTYKRRKIFNYAANVSLTCGEVCEQECSTTLDTDEDGVVDVEDNCIYNCNSDQFDADQDGLGDVCNPDPGCGGCVNPPCEQECIIE